MQPGQPGELLRTRCTSGWLIITDTAIKIELKGLLGMGGRLDIMPRQALTGAHMENTMPAVLGKGGGNMLVFSGAGKQLVAKMVNPADALRAMQILGYA